jgi:hypothetical protein
MMPPVTPVILILFYILTNNPAALYFSGKNIKSSDSFSLIL